MGLEWYDGGIRRGLGDDMKGGVSNLNVEGRFKNEFKWFRTVRNSLEFIQGLPFQVFIIF